MRLAPLLLLLLVGSAGCQAPAMLGMSGPDDPYELEFVGAATLASATLRSAIALDLADYVESDFRRAFIDDAAFEVREEYLRRGFPDATVRYAIDDSGKKPRVVFTIVEGPRTTIEAIAISGNRAEGFDDESIRGWFGGPRTGLLGRGDLYWVADNVADARRVIEQAYVSTGYLDARVAEPVSTFSEDRTRVSLRVTIQEGVRYEVESVVLQPAGGATELWERARELTAGYVGRPYYPRLPYELRGEILDLATTSGFPDATVVVEPGLDRTEKVARMAVTLEPGTRVEIGEVLYSGNVSTGESFLNTRLRTQAGDLYDAAKVRATVRSLYRTGLFRSVVVELAPGDGEVRDLLVELEEAPSREYSIEPGFGSYELFRLRMEAREKNIVGTGLQVRARTDVAVRAQRALLAFTDPWFLGVDYDLTGDIALSYDRREEPSFTREEAGAGFFVTRRWEPKDLAARAWRDDETAVGFQFRRSELTDVDIDDAVLLAEEETVDISSLKLTQRHSTRRPVLVPTSGVLAEVSFEFAHDALASELEFVKTDVALSGYHELREGTILGASVRAGAIVPIEGTDVIPLQERYFNGGGNSVRSFQESELGPLDDDGEPLGGEAYTTLNAELRQRLAGNFSTALFVDAGNVSNEYQDWSDFQDFETGVGIGLRYELPVGPLRLDLGVNPSADDDEDEFVLHFAIGLAF